MKKHLLILSLCMGAIVNTAQAAFPDTITSIGEAWWGSGNKWINVTEKLKYCIGQSYCGVKPTIDYLTDPIPGQQKRLYVHGVKCDGKGSSQYGGFALPAQYVDENNPWGITCY